MDKDKAFWKQKVAEFHDSKMSIHTWCRKYGYKRSCLKFWIKHFQNREDTAWTELIVEDTPVDTPADGIFTVRYHDAEFSLPLSALEQTIEVVMSHA